MAENMSITDAENVLREFSRVFRAADRLKEAASSVVRADADTRKQAQVLKELADKTERLKQAHAESEGALANVQTVLKAANERLDGIKQQIAEAEKARDAKKRAIEQEITEALASHRSSLDLLDQERQRVAKNVQEARDQLAAFHRQLEALHAGA